VDFLAGPEPRCGGSPYSWRIIFISLSQNSGSRRDYPWERSLSNMKNKSWLFSSLRTILAAGGLWFAGPAPVSGAAVPLAIDGASACSTFEIGAQLESSLSAGSR